MRIFYLFWIHDTLQNDKVQFVQFEAQYTEAMRFIDGWLRIYSLVKTNDANLKNTPMYQNVCQKYNKIVENMKYLKTKRDHIVRLPGINETTDYRNILSRTQVEEAFRHVVGPNGVPRDEYILAGRGECRTGQVVKIKVNENQYALKLPIEHDGIKMRDIISELKNESRVYRRLLLMYEIKEFYL